LDIFSVIFLSSVVGFAFFSGILIQRMIQREEQDAQREEQHARNERKLNRVVKYLKETAAS
jgi:sensor domain CHASE-containing protein